MYKSYNKRRQIQAQSRSRVPTPRNYVKHVVDIPFKVGNVILEKGDTIRIYSPKIDEEGGKKSEVSMDEMEKKMYAGNKMTAEEMKEVDRLCASANEKDKETMNAARDKMKAGKQLTDNEKKMMAGYMKAGKKK